MAALESLEKTLDEAFVKNAPFQLPKNVKEWIVQYLPYINLFFGVVSLWAALGIYNAARVTNSFVDYANELSRVYGGETIDSTRLNWAVWLGVLTLAVQGVLWIAAFSGTKNRQKSGWNLLFYALLINFAYGVVTIFTYYGGIGSFLGSLLGTAVGLYFLFQIRSYYLTKKSEKTTTKVKPSKK